MELDFNNELDIDLSEYEKLYNKLFAKTLKLLKKNENSIMSVTFVDKPTIHEINKTYRFKDAPTDVISFAFLDDKNEVIIGDIPVDLGEIYICYEVADENRQKYQNSIKRELCFLFVHGLLHLLGYDHQTKEQEEQMFPLQEVILEGEL